MEVKDLQAKMSGVDIVLEIIEVSDIREFSKFGKPGRVAKAKAKDTADAEITLTLWNEQIDQFKQGMKVRLIDGFVNEWQGELQLTTGRNGRLEVVE